MEKSKQKKCAKTLRKWRDATYLENYFFVADIISNWDGQILTKIIAKYLEGLQIEMRKCNC